jgi:hypothetical protein
MEFRRDRLSHEPSSPPHGPAACAKHLKRPAFSLSTGPAGGGAVRSYNPRTGRPERAPKPSIEASVPSSAKSCSRTSRSLAKFCSLSSSPKARSASLSSLFNVRFFRCKARTWFHHCRTSSAAAPTRWYAGGHRTAFAAAEAPNLCANRPSPTSTFAK